MYVNSNQPISETYRFIYVGKNWYTFCVYSSETKITHMITSIEIAKILQAQKLKKIKNKCGFDAAILGLGIHLKGKKKKIA